MTPKLYDEVSLKMVDLWGDYAGWAHSVLFTSDLKAFATYGLEESSSSKPVSSASTPGPPSPAKRKRKASSMDVMKTEVVTVTTSVEVEESTEGFTLAERVKRRRR
ncbi:hypothetical protein EUX98_g6692 [Antrodiella citrinella]|uniref:HhH-GPD domain-containing protein n=1 Tax=Antrodiella citrinella TaxID=2447956 RepID=A0A4S4MND9_9APHY|nr:hypothetical protein EUX98_g6692 [Antrodiella citrinella]